MRSFATCVVSMLLTGCLGPPREPLRDSVETDSGLSIAYNGCLLFGHYDKRGNVSFAGIALRDEKGVRIDPAFVIAKEGVSENAIMLASLRIQNFQDQFDWICGEHPGDSPERRAMYDVFRNDALVALVETALRFETLTTEAEYGEEIAAARKLDAEFDARRIGVLAIK